MDWQDVKKIIRRFLRDPDARIWDDAFLLNVWNDEQERFDRKSPMLETVEAIRVPPYYQFSYIYDWEWAFTTGKSYQAFTYHQQSDMVHQNRWEGQLLGYSSASDNDQGDHFCHPWEAWAVTENPGDLVPIRFPERFERMLAAYWDREPLDYIEFKNLQSNDQTYRTRMGKPTCLYRLDEVSNEAYLYPLPSAPVWDDSEDKPAIMGIDGDSYSQNYGTVVDSTGMFISSYEGGTFDAVSVEDNLFIVYKHRPMNAPDDNEYPDFIKKYIRHSVIETAYRANTDGKIASLADYWQWRGQIGMDTIKTYRSLRKTDRDYRLVSQPAVKSGDSPRRSRTGSFESIFGTSEIST